MQLYHQQKPLFSSLKEKPFKLEKEIQTLFETNLAQITGLKFVKSEFTVKNVRLDTLAFDEESQSFVIIEYKRGKNDSVIDQGFTYLQLMLEYKEAFILEYNESCDKTLKRDAVDWSQSKIIFVSPSFTNYQKQASNFKDLPIELWEIKQFENDIVVINALKKSQSAPSFKTIQNTASTEISKVIDEIKIYTEEEHLNDKSDEIKELYEIYKEAVLNLSTDIEIVPRKQYIAFKKERNIIDIVIQNKSLKLWINLRKGELDDPKKLAKDVANIGHHGNGDYQLQVSDTKDLEYIMSLVKQSLTTPKR